MNFGGTSSPIDRGLKNLAKSNTQLKTQLTNQGKQEMFGKKNMRIGFCVLLYLVLQNALCKLILTK